MNQKHRMMWPLSTAGKAAVTHVSYEEKGRVFRNIQDVESDKCQIAKQHRLNSAFCRWVGILVIGADVWRRSVISPGRFQEM